MRLIILALFLSNIPAWALAGGSLSGSVKDPSGGLVPGAQITLSDIALKSEFKTVSDTHGFYSFPALPVGRYALRIEAEGFKTQQKNNLSVDADAALRVDALLEVGRKSDTVTVVESADSVETQVETVATHLGEVVSQTEI